MGDLPAIETERFTLRPLVRGDAAALYPTLSDEAQCRYLSRPHFGSVEELADWLTDPDWDGDSWVAMDKADGATVGRFVAVPTFDPDVSEIGFITVAERQGSGIGREGSQALVDYLFRVGKKRRLVAEVDFENAASIALLERLGFQREACLREHERTHIGIRDVLIYGMLRRDWQSLRAGG